jgi:uncharacterized protein
MKMHLETGDGRNVIRQYGSGQVTVNRDVYRTSIVVLPESLITDWPPAGFDALLPEHFERLAALRPEVLLLGTGARLRFPRPETTRAVLEAGIGFEVMDTAAACRTYNILMSEGRRVAAALLMIEA